MESVEKHTLVKVGKWAGRWMYEIMDDTHCLGNLRYFKCYGQWVIIKTDGSLSKYSSFAKAKAAALNL